MNPTSILSSDVFTNMTSTNESKSVLASDVSVINDAGFFDQLTQFVSGDGDKNSDSAAVSTTDNASTDTDNASTDTDTASTNTASTDTAGSEYIETDTNGSEYINNEDSSSNVLSDEIDEIPSLATENVDVEDVELTTGMDNNGSEITAPVRQNQAKIDGEALLQRLNEANAVLQTTDRTQVDNPGDGDGDGDGDKDKDIKLTAHQIKDGEGKGKLFAVNTEVLRKHGVISQKDDVISLEDAPLDLKPTLLVPQLSSSFGSPNATLAARLESAVAQTSLQINQNQAETANALSERINIMLAKNLKHVDIRLDPPELGRMQIKLLMNQDQASVQFMVSNQHAKEMVEQTIPRLREMLHQHGLQLAQSSVQHQDAGGSQTFSGNQASQDRSPEDGSKSNLGENDQDVNIQGSGRDIYVNSSKDRVDYYA